MENGKPRTASMPLRPVKPAKRNQLDLSEVFEIINVSNSMGLHPMVDRDTPSLDEIYEKQLERRKNVLRVQREHQPKWELEDAKLVG